MFCESLFGKILPLMEVFKLKFLFDAWINDGSVNAVCDSTKSDWFDGRLFKKKGFLKFLSKI